MDGTIKNSVKTRAQVCLKQEQFGHRCIMEGYSHLNVHCFSVIKTTISKKRKETYTWFLVHINLLYAKLCWNHLNGKKYNYKIRNWNDFKSQVKIEILHMMDFKIRWSGPGFEIQIPRISKKIEKCDFFLGFLISYFDIVKSHFRRMFYNHLGCIFNL